MCNVCYSQESGFASYSAVPSTMCDSHFFEWQEEKIYNDLDCSREDIYLQIAACRLDKCQADPPQTWRLIHSFKGACGKPPKKCEITHTTRRLTI